MTVVRTIAATALLLAAATQQAAAAGDLKLGEGIMTGHPDIPEFRFDADQVGAIIAYQKSIQQP